MTQHSASTFAQTVTFKTGTGPKRIDRRYLRDVSGLTDEEVHALCRAREYSLQLSAELRTAR